MLHIYRLIYPNYDVIKNKIETTTQYTLVFSTASDRTSNLTKYAIITLQSILMPYQQHFNFFLYYFNLKISHFPKSILQVIYVCFVLPPHGMTNPL